MVERSGGRRGGRQDSADTSDSFYSPHPKFRHALDAANPITTPRGLAPANNTQLVNDLDNAYNVVSTNFASVGRRQRPWGSAHYTTLVYRSGATQALSGIAANDPLSGADDPFGPLRVVNPAVCQRFGEFISYGGDGYVQVIEFTPTGSQGGTLLTYGNASRPNSPHITDQLPFLTPRR